MTGTESSLTLSEGCVSTHIVCDYFFDHMVEAIHCQVHRKKKISETGMCLVLSQACLLQSPHVHLKGSGPPRWRVGVGLEHPFFFSGKVQGQSREQELCCGIVGGLTVVAFLVSWRVSSLIERSPCVMSLLSLDPL